MQRTVEPRRRIAGRAWICVIFLTAITLLLGHPLLNGRDRANAGHTLAGGDCWQPGTPLLCRTTWNSTDRIINLNLYNQFTHVRPDWYPNAETACNNWHNFVPSTPTNDIYCHWTGTSPYLATAVYLKTGTNGTYDLTSTTYAITWNCGSNGVCIDTNTALNIWYSEVYFNTSGVLDNASSAVRTKVFAHEMGHTLGLFHHDATGYLMRQGAYTTAGPSSGDYGQLPACSGAASTWGVRCIYHFNQ
jgi:hypothetical protein